jgi:Uma2 family endonuclease
MSTAIVSRPELDETLTIPAWVVDFESFVRWTRSGEFPRGRGLSWLGDVMVVEIGGQEVFVPDWIVDLDSFLRWADSDEYPERGQVSWFSGERVFDMSPQNIDSHARVKQMLYRYLGEFVDERDIGELLPDQTLFVHADGGTAHEPDALVILWETLEAGRVAYREITEGRGRLMQVTGSPDLLIEVVSQSSVAKDRQRLPERYFAAGVREYWIVDARAGEIEFDLFVRGETEFLAIEPDADGYRRSPVLGAGFRMERTENSRGINRYELLHR